jgi:hypothetical protein
MSQNTALPIDLQWFGGEDNPADGKGGDGNTTPAKGSESSDWMADLPDDLKSSETLGKFKGPKGHHALAKSYVELEKRLGKAIVRPSEDAKPEEWNRFYSQVGRPESADKYSFESVKGFDVDQSFAAWLRQEAYARGMTQGQAAQLYASYGKQATEKTKAARDAAQAESEKANAHLREAWGNNFDHNTETATRFIERVGGEGTAEYLKAKGYDRDPVLLTLFANAGELTGAHKFVPGSRGGLKGQANRYAYMDEKK